MSLIRRLAIVFLAPWVLLSVQIPGIQHGVPAAHLILNGLVAAALVWLWFLVPVRAPHQSFLGAALVVIAWVIWNLPSHAFLPLPIGHLEPFVVMLAVGAVYRMGVSMIEPLRPWLDAERR